MKTAGLPVKPVLKLPHTVVPDAAGKPLGMLMFALKASSVELCSPASATTLPDVEAPPIKYIFSSWCTLGNLF
jgi:hypothetical protein